MSTFFVFSVIMVSKPPMTPASATGFFASAMTRSSGRQLAVDAVECLQHLAFASAAHDDRAAFEQIEIEGMGGMAKLVERVVRGVGGVVDRARAQQLKPVYDQLGRWTDLHVANDAGGVSRAALRVFDDDGKGTSFELVIPTGGVPALDAGAEGSAVPGSFGSTGFSATL